MDILMTLGHNSSVIAVDEEGNIVNAYEEERLTRVKSDSRFPINALTRICNHDDICGKYISHWFDDFDLHNCKDKYLYKSFLSGDVTTLSEEFTHHDAHAYSVLAFYKNHTEDRITPFNIFVCDGFGNNGEVFSVYYYYKNKITLLKRFYGYKNSLGLLYQYATKFCGMKMHQDEYKFLGYESHINNEMSKRVHYISYEVARQIYESMWRSVKNEHGDMINELAIVEDLLTGMFNNVLCNVLDIRYIQPDSVTDIDKRIIIGYFIQSVIENVNCMLLDEFEVQNVMLSGGVYYNVKLNNSIMKRVNKICVNPLAGDQGAAIGLYEYHNPDKIKFKSLLWGRRDGTILKYKSLIDYDIYTDGKTDVHSDYVKYSIDRVVEIIANGGIVNLVHGNMEFGPRALCHTSTLALPTKENVDLINKMNGRSTVMPMAPVLLKENVDKFFVTNDKVIGSDRYMVITYDYRIDKHKSTEGVMHNYPVSDTYSGRPQIVDDKESVIYKILEKLQEKHSIFILINTSFNVHGKPIVFSKDDVISDYEYQLANCDKNNERPILEIMGII